MGLSHEGGRTGHTARESQGLKSYIRPERVQRVQRDPMGPHGTHGAHGDFWVFLGILIFIKFCGVWSGPMTFLTLLGSILVLEFLKTVG